MACTFLKAQGFKIGSSLMEDNSLDYANELINKANKKGVELLLPIDAVILVDGEEADVARREPVVYDPGMRLRRKGWREVTVGRAVTFAPICSPAAVRF